MALARTHVHSSLTLQMLLFFNIWYSIAFFVLIAGLYLQKVLTYAIMEEFAIVTPILTFVFGVVEIARLRLGYSGNLRERVPELSAFLLLTCFPSIPFVGFLTFGQVPMLPREPIIGVPLLLILIAEVVFAYRGVRMLIKKQTAQFFRLCQEAPAAGVTERAPDKIVT